MVVRGITLNTKSLDPADWFGRLAEETKKVSDHAKSFSQSIAKFMASLGIFMGLFDFFKEPDPDAKARQAASAQRQADIVSSLRSGAVPTSTRTRLEARAYRPDAVDRHPHACRTPDRSLAWDPTDRLRLSHLLATLRLVVDSGP